MTTKVYHGSHSTAQPHIGMCLTPNPDAAAGYAADKNGGNTITEMLIDLNALRRGPNVDYDYDAEEPIIPDGYADSYDIAEYTDCDMRGISHDTILLLTPAAVGAVHVIGTHHFEGTK